MRRISCLVLLSSLLFVLGCGSNCKPDVPAPPTGDSGPPTVTLVKPQPKPIRRTVEQPGTIQADEETHLHAKLPGFVLRVHADIGQRVKGPKFDRSGTVVEPGDLLAEIAIPEMEEEAAQKKALVNQAEAEVEQARKSLIAAGANVTAMEAAVTQAKAGVKRSEALYARWTSEFDRIESFAKKGVIGTADRDEVQHQLRAADADRDESNAKVLSAQAAVLKAKADRDKVDADVKAAEARKEVAKADARRFQELLGYTKIRAPFDGVVTRRRVNTGDYLQASTGKEGWIFSVARLDPVRAVIDVPEADAGALPDKTKVELTVQVIRGAAITGAVTRTSWALETGARTLRTEIDLPNKEGRLRPGMYVSGRFTVELPAKWALPMSAVVIQGDQAFGYRVEGGKTVRVPVRVGLRDSQWVEVTQMKRTAESAWEDVTGKEEFVQSGLNGLSEGQTVKVGATEK